MKQMIFLIGLVALTSCKKEGCTDAEATNYDEKATKMDGSCTYEAQVTWWYNESTADWLANSINTTDIKVKIDNQAVASSDPSATFWTQAPACGEAGSMTYLIEMSNIKTHSFSYVVQDHWKNEHWTGNVTVEANDCETIQLNN